ncbi:MAG TPA: carboxypeptidase-like regulatory domain-containing protein [Myxococcales bacterium]|nr:carboxypeptidase-like regulatory domain-containing protein [Myxococcales bacterium]
MARLVMFLGIALVSACGNGVVTLAGDDAGLSPPPTLDSFGPGSPSRPPGGGAGTAPETVVLSGQVFYGLGLSALGGATVSLDPAAAPAATTDDGGNFSFADVPTGSYVVTATFPGLATGSQAVVVADAPPPIVIGLEASTQLFANDGGDDVPWLGFAPDGGPLYASSGTALWQLAGGGATPVWADGTAVEPLGFGASGEIVYLSDCDGGAPRSCRLGFGAEAAADGGRVELFPDGGPFVIGDQVVYAAEPLAANGTQAWSAATSSSFTALGPFFAAPPPVAAAGAVAFLSLQGGQAVTYSAAGVTQVADFAQALPYGYGGSSLVPLGPDSIAALSGKNGQGAILDASGAASVTFDQGTRLAPGAPGTAIVSYVSAGQQWIYRVAAGGTTEAAWVMLPTTAWPPLPSPDGRRAAFVGTPYVADFATGSYATLAEAAALAQFDASGSALLVVDGSGNLHAVTFESGGVADRTLEGVDVTAAAFTPDGQSVVYAGGDALANAGVFVEPAVPPPPVTQATP